MGYKALYLIGGILIIIGLLMPKFFKTPVMHGIKKENLTAYNQFKEYLLMSRQIEIDGVLYYKDKDDKYFWVVKNGSKNKYLLNYDNFVKEMRW